MREYWIVHPNYPLIEQFTSEEGAFKKIGSFSAEDEMTPHIFPDPIPYSLFPKAAMLSPVL